MPELQVEVAYAMPQQQHVIPVTVPAGSTLLEAIHLSGILARVPEIDLTTAGVGVFGKPQALDHRLRDGDRVEIYRPLRVDPTQARRARAKKS